MEFIFDGTSTYYNADQLLWISVVTVGASNGYLSLRFTNGTNLNIGFNAGSGVPIAEVNAAIDSLGAVRTPANLLAV